MFAYLQYLIVRGFSFLINLPPEAWALGFGRLLGRVAYYLDREHRKVALQNLELAFGREKSKEELKTIARGTFQNLGMNAVEILPYSRNGFRGFPEASGNRRTGESSEGAWIMKKKGPFFSSPISGAGN